MKKNLMTSMCVFSLLAITSFGQGFLLIWNTTEAVEDQLGNQLTDGSLAQLIVTLTSAGGNPAGLDTTSSDGLTGSDRVVNFSNSTAGNIAGSIGSTIPDPDIGATDNIFVRVFNAPSGGSGSDIPSPTFDAGQGANGIWYADMPVIQLPSPSVNYQYQFDVNQADWTFAATAIPEPNSLMLMGLGTVAILIRRARRS